ncbi:MAG: hypothetical protein D6798_03625 [Deltaproteobacteria bacterium]|nr:MAG: hypothetical protein D6798_03625 [Deltaproteobacteria bacterium]
MLVGCRAPSGEGGGAGGGDTAAESPEIPDRVHLADGRIRDRSGRALVWRGVNVSNASKDPATGFYGWAEAEDYAALAAWGFDSVRLLTFWEAIEPEPGVIDDAYLDGLVERVAMARDAGLSVILDMHQDLFGRGFGGDGAPAWACDADLYASYEPQDPWSLGYLTDEIWTCFDRFWSDDSLQEHYAAAWGAVAERVADEPAVVAFDLMNEPWPARGDAEAFSAGTLQRFYERIAAVLGEAAPGRIIIVEPITLVQYGLLDPGVGAIEGAEVVFGPHYYHPTVHEGGAYDGDPTPMETAFAAYDAHADAMGSTWWLGEWGGPEGEAGGIAEYLADIDAMLAARAVGSALWSYDESGGFAILDGAGALRPDVQAALQHPRVVAYGGDPGGASWDGDTLRWTVVERAGVPARSTVWIGRGVDPSAIDVQGGESWRYDEETGLVEVEGLGALSLTLSPG